MPLLRRRPLMRAAMVGTAGYAIGKRAAAGQGREAAPEEPSGGQQEPSQPAPPPSTASTEAEKIEGLTKLKGLLDSGVLTQEQFEAERQKLLAGE